jgi:hypothetical protein
MATNQAFFDHFEKTRLEIEGRLLHLPESSQLLQDHGTGPASQAQQYLHAIPTLTALMRILLHSPRTLAALSDRMARAGAPPSLDTKAVGRVLMCFALAGFYRRTARRTGDPHFAQQATRIACLSALGPESLERVDWAVQALARGRHGGSQDWLAPALLLVVWLTGMESPGKARQVMPLLDQLSQFVDDALEAALDNRIHMQFPW